MEASEISGEGIGSAFSELVFVASDVALASGTFAVAGAYKGAVDPELLEKSRRVEHDLRVAPPGPERRNVVARAWPVPRALRIQKAEALLFAQATMKSWSWNPKQARVPFEGSHLQTPSGPVDREAWPDLVTKHLEDIYATPFSEIRKPNLSWTPGARKLPFVGLAAWGIWLSNAPRYIALSSRGSASGPSTWTGVEERRIWHLALHGDHEGGAEMGAPIGLQMRTAARPDRFVFRRRL